VKPTARGEELTIDDFVAISRAAATVASLGE